MKRRALSFLAFSLLLTAATPAMADCSAENILGLPAAREGALGYSKNLRMLYVCTGTAWMSAMEL